MDKEIVFLIEESPEGGFEARALGLSIFTDGETIDEVRGNVLDAVHCHFGESEWHAVRISFGGVNA